MPPSFRTRKDDPRSKTNVQQSIPCGHSFLVSDHLSSLCFVYFMISSTHWFLFYTRSFLPNIRSRIRVKTQAPTISHPQSFPRAEREISLNDPPSPSRDRPGKDSRDENSPAEGSSQDGSGPQEK